MEATTMIVGIALGGIVLLALRLAIGLFLPADHFLNRLIDAPVGHFDNDTTNCWDGDGGDMCGDD